MKEKIKELIPYIVIIIIVLLIRTFIATPVRVDGTSMNKSLADGDILLLYKLANIDRFDIVVLREEDNNEKIIKRVYGMPGDIVQIDDGYIYINREKIEDEYGYGETSDFDEITLGEDEYFILGDNRLVSKDSRILGPVKKNSIQGVTTIRFWPLNKIGKV